MINRIQSLEFGTFFGTGNETQSDAWPGLRRTGRPGTGRSSSSPSWGTSEDEDVQDENQDGDEDVRGRQIKNFDGTSEDGDVQDED